MKKILVWLLAVCLLCGCAQQTEPAASSTQPSQLPETQMPTRPAESSEPTVTEPEAPERASLLDFLRIAAQPVGNTMYIWGGGWNEADTGAGTEAVSLGVSPAWAQFAALQDESYDYRNTRYQIHDGLDCSGYVGWAVYNVLETENGAEGYVYPSTQMAAEFAMRGLGTYIPAENMTQWLPGDVMSMQGHCWIVVGMCDDGSVLLLHSSPPGVRFCGTKAEDGSRTQAVELAERIMQSRYPEWYRRYPGCACPYTYLTASSALRWDEQVLRDDGLGQMTAQQVVDAIFAGQN